MKISSHDTDEKVLIIAEIGNNHEGNFELAKELILKAYESGADAVKFQIIIPEKLIASQDQKRIQQLKKFQLSYKDFEHLAAFTKEKGLIFLASPFDIESADFLNTISPAFKVASGDNNFYPLIDSIISKKKPFLLSTGLLEEKELEQTILYLEQRMGKDICKEKLAILHCVSNYPVPDNEANLLSVKHLNDNYPYTVGYSDHTKGIDACVFAVALGATIIEKHFTIDKNYSDFHDHKLSADPSEMKELVKKIKDLKSLLGTYNKTLSFAEEEMKKKLRRSIAAKTFIPAGHKLTLSDLTWLRPGNGLPIGQEGMILGKTSKSNIIAGELITLDQLED